MFRITEDPSSESLVQCLAKNYKNDSIMSVDMDKVAVVGAYCDPLCACNSYTVNYTHAHTHTQRVRTCCHNPNLVHVNRHDRIILITFSQALYKAP